MWSADVLEMANARAVEMFGPQVWVRHRTGDHAAGVRDQLAGLFVPAGEPWPDGWAMEPGKALTEQGAYLVPDDGAEGEPARAFLDEFNAQITSAQSWPVDMPGPPPPGMDAYLEVWRARSGS